MATPWERIADNAYEDWLSERQVIASEYNDASLVDRSELRMQFEQRLHLQQQQQFFQVKGTINRPSSHAGARHALFRVAADFSGIYPPGLDE
jgi:hypothetical protein